MVVGQNFQKLQDNITLSYGENLPPFVKRGLSTFFSIQTPALFVAQLLLRREDTLSMSVNLSNKKPGGSLRRASDGPRKTRLEIDYSETINKFTVVDKLSSPTY